jgi:hypothetical protein
LAEAVAFWAAFFRLEEPTAESKLFTSADVDFEGEGAAQAARKAGDLLEVRRRFRTWTGTLLILAWSSSWTLMA